MAPVGKNTSSTTTRSQKHKTIDDYPEIAGKTGDEIIILLYKEIRNFRQQVNSLQTTIEKSAKKEEQQQLRINVLENEIEKLHIASRVNNVIIHGVDMSQYKDKHLDQVVDIIVKDVLKADPKKLTITNSKFLGRNNKAPILLSILTQSQKRYMQSHYRNLKGTSYSFTDDLTPTQLVRRKVLLQERKDALENGAQVVKIYDKSIFVDGDWFDINEKNVISKRPPPTKNQSQINI